MAKKKLQKAIKKENRQTELRKAVKWNDNNYLRTDKIKTNE